ncbi:MAG: acetylornithine transaminase [Frankiaceae bacterium]
MTRYDELAARWDATMMGTYGTPSLALTHGSGCRAWDVEGREYLDLLAGIAVNSLGHAHPAVVEAVSRQVATLAHTSNLAMHEPGIRLAERLLGLLGRDGRVFFCNSGTEANEAALKVVRRHAGPSRPRVISTQRGFHGRTLGALALTGKASIREPFGPFGPFDVQFVPYGDAAALAAVVDDRTAAVFLEPTQGEAGVIPPPPGYLAAARSSCDETGALLVLDEVQSGIGRTGWWFAHQAEGVEPDVLTLAKGLGAGLPIGACIGFGAAGSALGRGDHGCTFGGNLVACAAAHAVLDVIESDDLLARAFDVGTMLATGLARLSDGGAPLLTGVRGKGLWLAALFESPGAPAFEAAAREAGFIVNAVGEEVVRLAPPLILTRAECSELLTALPSLLDAAAEAVRVSA